jgi:hypothetical protein
MSGSSNVSMISFLCTEFRVIVGSRNSLKESDTAGQVWRKSMTSESS